MAVRPKSLLQVAVLGRRELVVEDHGVGVERLAQPGELLRLAPAHEGGRVGRVASLRRRVRRRRRPRVSTSWASSSRSASTISAVRPGNRTPTTMMRSRIVRSMSVPGRSLYVFKEHP